MMSAPDTTTVDPGPGWRLLVNKEMRREGDEFKYRDDPWRPISPRFIGLEWRPLEAPVRRRISPLPSTIAPSWPGMPECSTCGAWWPDDERACPTCGVVREDVPSPPAPDASGLSARTRTLPPWQGDLQDDCSLEVGDLLAHAECMGEHVAYDPQDKRDKWAGESWFLAVYRGKEQVFHSGEPGGSFSSGELARAVAETIIRAELAALVEAGVARAQTALEAIIATEEESGLPADKLAKCRAIAREALAQPNAATTEGGR